MKEVIAYSLYQVEAISTYLPQAYIVEENDKGELEYMRAKALKNTVGSYGIDISSGPHGELLDLCEELSIENLEAKYGQKGRKKLSLSQLYEDDKISHIVKQFLSRKMGRFLKLVTEHELPMCLEIERKTRLQQLRILYTSQQIEPVLSFRKTQTGIHYQIQLRNGNASILPCQHDTQIILDDPAYVLIDYCLFSLSYINANKLKPFQKNDSIFIPERMTRTYFQKFIMDVISKVDIEAEGFEVIQEGTLKGSKISVTRDFIHDYFLITLILDYGNTSFQYPETAEKRTRLQMDEGGKVTIYQTIRDRKAEKSEADKLLQLGLDLTPTNRFSLPDNNDKTLLYWLYSNKDKIEKSGIDVSKPVVENKTLHLESGVINLDTIKENDWFDMGGEVVVGKYRIPFADLLDNIRENNFFFKLPDDTYFLIPEEWMSRYEMIAKFGQKEGKKVRISKSQYTLVEELEDKKIAATELVITDHEIDYTPDDKLKVKLRPYQIEGVKWLIAHQMNGLGACLADDMGLGKTLQTLAVLSYTKDLQRREPEDDRRGQQLTLFEKSRLKELNPLQALIVLPASLIFNWYAEIKKFTPHFHICRYIGPGRKKITSQIDKFDIVLTTYQTALRDIQILRKVHWEYIILDESQMIKNRQSKIFQSLHGLDAHYRVSLSGTPVENSLSDLWSQMQFINPDILGSFSFFKENFLWPIEKQQDEAALDQLKTMVQPFILRRTKEEVAKDLPPLTEQLQYVEMSSEQKKIFESEKSAARNFLLSVGDADPQYKFHVFRALLRLRQIANHPVLVDNTYVKSSGKFDFVTDQLETLLKSRHKVLIFSSFKSQLKLFQDYLEEKGCSYCLLTGDTSQQNRKKVVSQFQKDPKYQVFLISIKAGGTGLNLTAADYVFILDPWWNPFVEKQAIARAHRIGQDKPVTVIKFASKDSIEEKIIKLQEKKQRLSDQLLDTEGGISLEKGEVEYLLG